MSDYTPTKEVVAECYVTTDPNPEGYGLMGMGPPTEEESRAEFDRFIAKVKADALREAGAAVMGERLETETEAGNWLDERADRVEGVS